MFSVITNICNKKTIGPTLIEFKFKNMNIVSMCAASPVVNTSNISSCKKMK